MTQRDCKLCPFRMYFCECETFDQIRSGEHIEKTKVRERKETLRAHCIEKLIQEGSEIGGG